MYGMCRRCIFGLVWRRELGDESASCRYGSGEMVVPPPDLVTCSGFSEKNADGTRKELSTLQALALPIDPRPRRPDGQYL